MAKQSAVEQEQEDALAQAWAVANMHRIEVRNLEAVLARVQAVADKWQKDPGVVVGMPHWDEHARIVTQTTRLLGRELRELLEHRTQQPEVSDG